MKQWFVVHTQPSKERVAVEHLLEQGFGVYLPTFKKTVRHARRAKEVITPLFPRYLFVEMDVKQALWRSINGTRGVAYLLTNNALPIQIHNQIVEDLKIHEKKDGFADLNSLVAFTKGDKVRVLEGAFKDQTAVFETLTDKQRVQLLLNCLGREMKISLPLDAVDAA